MKIDDKVVERWWIHLLTSNPRRRLAAVGRLEKAGEQGCDPAELLQKPYRVQRSQTEGWERTSRDQVRTLKFFAGKTREKLGWLEKSEVGRQIFPNMSDLHAVYQQLDNVVKNATRVVRSLQKKHTPRTDSAIANVVAYVEKNAGKHTTEKLGHFSQRSWVRR
jgi:hypothetical protein